MVAYLGKYFSTFRLGMTTNRKIYMFRYYEKNEVQKFAFSHNILPPKLDDADRKSGPVKKENEFSTMWVKRSVIVVDHSLPGVMRWFPVVSENSVSRVFTFTRAF